MSKKQMSKKKLTVKVMAGETAIVMSNDVALHIAESYDFFANSSEKEEAQWYRDVADMIRYQALENYFEPGSNDDEEW